MNLENLISLIKDKEGNLSDGSIEIAGVKTETDVDQLIELLARDSLIIGKLSIKVDDKVSDYFISKFVNMDPKPKLIGLSLPNIKLTHSSWKQFFEGLQDFRNLKSLSIENSNFDYSNDLGYLGGYLSSNPMLNAIDLCNDNKVDDKTFKSEPTAKQLYEYLQNNTHLISFEYGNKFDHILSKNISKEIEQKLAANALEAVNDLKIPQAVSKLQDDSYLQKVKENLDQYVKNAIEASLKKGTKDEKKIELDIYDMPISIKMLKIGLAELKENYDLAMQDTDFKESEQAEKIRDLGKYYYSQNCLVDALDKMYQQELKASAHDKPILHNLREDFLKEWKSASTTENLTERNQKMNKLFDSMIDNCDEAAGKVKDKTSGALIKNILLVLSAILTVGISLGIYAAVTKKSRAERGSFFFKDTELSKNAIDEVSKSVEDAQTEVKKGL